MKTPKPNSIIAEFLGTISDLDQKKTDTRMLIAAQIDDAIKAKGWKKKDLLTAMGKQNPSLVTKWLSGTHNFTMDTLVELGAALDIQLLNLYLTNKAAHITYIVVSSQQKTTNELWKYQQPYA